MATINDIAKLAGVSKASVSLALSDHPRISQETKERVRRIAKEVGYMAPKRQPAAKPNNASIGILFLDAAVEKSGEFFRETILGISEASSNLDYNTMLISVNGDSDDIGAMLERSGVQGAVVVSPSPEVKGLEEVVKRGFPLVFIGKRHVGERECSFVASDNHGGGKAATQYLIGLGHGTIGIAIPPRDRMFPWEEDRIDGYLSALRQSGITLKEELIFTVSSPYSESDSCWHAMREAEATAIFAITPQVGLPVLQHLRHSGQAVPEQISLIVFDDFSSAELEHPPVTVMKQEMATLGKLAVQTLLEKLASPGQPPRQLLLPTQLVARNSCSAPPKPQ